MTSTLAFSGSCFFFCRNRDIDLSFEVVWTSLFSHSICKRKVSPVAFETRPQTSSVNDSATVPLPRLLQRIQSSESFANRNGGSSGGSGGGSGGSGGGSGGGSNADIQGLVPRITQLLDKLHSTRQHLHQAWHVRKLQLDQCFQLRLFEQDAEKVGVAGDCVFVTRWWSITATGQMAPNRHGTLIKIHRGRIDSSPFGRLNRSESSTAAYEELRLGLTQAGVSALEVGLGLQNLSQTWRHLYWVLSRFWTVRIWGFWSRPVITR